MPPESTQSPLATAWSQRIGLRHICALWCVVVAIILVRGLIWPKSNSTYLYFSQGGENWLAGNELYQHVGGSCRYSPLFHAFMVPLASLPERLGSLLWRLLNLGIFVGGLICWARALLPRDLAEHHKAWLSLLLLPLSIGNLNNAQANPMVIGLVLLALAAIPAQRWHSAALCIALACLLKIYPIAIGLLLILLYPRQFTGRLLLWLAVGLGLPFVLQQPGYVARQYGNWMHLLKVDDRSRLDTLGSYRDFWLLLRLTSAPVSRAAYEGLQVLMALLTAVLCWYKARQGAGQRVVLNTVLGLGCLWMTLFGPATESCTYILLAPTLAWCVVDAWRQPQSRALRSVVTASYGLMLVSYMANWSRKVAHVHSLGPHAWAALLLLGVLVRLCLSPSDRAVHCETLSAGKAQAA